MLRTKLQRIALIVTGLLCLDLTSAVKAIPIKQIEEGEKCGKLSQVVEEGMWSYKCTKVKKKKLWQLNGMSTAFTATTSSTTTTTVAPATTIPSVPLAPSGLVVSIKTPFDGTGTIRWTDNSNNEDNFYISNIDPSKLGSTSLSSIWFKGTANISLVDVTGYQNGFSYCYWVMASNSVGNSAWTGPVCTLAGTATTTTTVYVPPTTAYTPIYGGGGGSSSTNWLGCYFKGKKMWGKVYVTPYSFDADVKVYQTPYSFDADLKVYNSRYSFDANSCGKWYVTSYSFDADFKVYFSPYSFSADFKIYVTPYSFDAGR